MRKWNGWGDNTVTYPLPENGLDLLQELAGEGRPQNDAALETVLASVPSTRLKEHRLISDDAMDRLLHARGQSLPDWIALRSGTIERFPDGVAQPSDDDDLVDLIVFAEHSGAQLIPYGGGTSVVGHINVPDSDRPVVTVDLRRLNQMEHFDEQSQLATFGAGVTGPALEAQLRSRGYTLGHFPQSFELSTLGGWIATRSSGQQSLGYGRIEDLFAGGRVISPAGTLELAPYPASAAGPDLKQLILGSEGRMGFIRTASMRVTPLPEAEEFHGVFFPDFALGERAVREMVQAGIPMSMMRLSTALETRTTLALAGHSRLLGLLERGLALRGIGDEKAMLLVGFTGKEKLVSSARKEAWSIAREHGGIVIGQQFGRQWHKGRFHTPYLRNTLWDEGYAVDTLETAISWRDVDAMLAAIESTLTHTLADTKVLAFSHLSHFYRQGASIYTTYLFPLSSDPAETLGHWRALKRAASETIVSHGGTISHQHGVGTDHAPYLEQEKGHLGMEVLADIVKGFDPQGVMNAGKLILAVGSDGNPAQQEETAAEQLSG